MFFFHFSFSCFLGSRIAEKIRERRERGREGESGDGQCLKSIVPASASLIHSLNSDSCSTQERRDPKRIIKESRGYR